MQSKIIKIALAWIGAFFCAWLFGNHMLDVSLIPPPFFFFVALLYTAVTFAKDKGDSRGNKVSIFESIFVKLSCLWVGIFLYLVFFGSNTNFFLLLTIFYIGLIYAPLIWVARKKKEPKKFLESFRLSHIYSLYYLSFSLCIQIMSMAL